MKYRLGLDVGAASVGLATGEKQEKWREGQVPPASAKKNAQPRLGVYIGGIKCLVADSSPPSEHLIQWPY